MNKLTLENINEVLQKEITISSDGCGNKITYNPSDLNYRVWHWSILSHIGTDPKIALRVFNYEEEEKELLEIAIMKGLTNHILR